VSTMDLSRAAWRKSSRSTQSGSCVEVAVVPASGEGPDTVVAVRDSKNRDGSVLAFTPAEWHAFTTRVKQRAFDLP